MHIPLINRIAPYILPLISHSPASSAPSLQPSTITIRPIHAHVHTFHNSSSPKLYLHNATTPQLLTFSPPDVSSFSTPEERQTYLLDQPSPEIASSPLTIRTVPTIIRRPKTRPPSITSWALSARQKSRPNLFNTTGLGLGMWIAPDYADDDGEWEDVEILAPDVTDRQTLITMAKITSNAYVTPDSGEWWPVGDWNASVPIGWEPDADGLRGHVFADPTNSTVIIAIKGTSAGLLGTGGPTAKNDKFNDNLLFSCCCARVDFSWTPVCDCYAGGYKCEQTCLEDALVAESVYATVGTNLYNNVTYMYPNASIWLAGHSLGGSVSSLIALSFGAPAVNFESPGDRLAARRLHLPLPPGMPSDKTAITHVYHTADPIPMGACTGTYSGCYAAGYALESRCHVGQTILYDTVTVKGWSVDARTHRIGEIINKVLADPWPVTNEPEGNSSTTTHSGQSSTSSWWGWGRKKGPGKGKKGEDPDDPEDDDGGWEKHGGVPRAESEDDCIDCFKWEFGDGWKKEPPTTGKDIRDLSQL